MTLIAWHLTNYKVTVVFPEMTHGRKHISCIIREHILYKQEFNYLDSGIPVFNQRYH